MHGIHCFLFISSGLNFLSLAAYFFKQNRASFIFLCAGSMAHLGYMISRGWIAGIFLPNGMFDGIFFLPLALAAVIIIAKFFAAEGSDIQAGIILVCIFSGLSLLYPKGIIPPTPNKITAWAHLFFATETAAQACFYLGALSAFLDIVKKTERNLYHTLIVWGFLLYCAAQVTGAVWAWLGWAAAFRWGSRHMLSALVWCYYVLYLHLRFMPECPARKKMIFAAAGFFVVLACSAGGYINEYRFPRIGE